MEDRNAEFFDKAAVVAIACVFATAACILSEMPRAAIACAASGIALYGAINFFVQSHK